MKYTVSLEADEDENEQARELAIYTLFPDEYRREWDVFMRARDHIAFERLDNMRRFDRMKDMLMDRERSKFLAFHVRTMNSTGFSWNLKENIEIMTLLARFLKNRGMLRTSGDRAL
jgi:hypothetical protein